MRNVVQLLSAALITAGVCLSGAARAEDGVASTSPALQAAPVVDDAPAQTAAPKLGLVVTGALLVLSAGGHIVLGAMAVHSGDVTTDCNGGQWCFGGFKAFDYEIGAASLAVGGILALVGIPLIVYGATAKKSAPQARVGISPAGITFAGTF